MVPSDPLRGAWRGLLGIALGLLLLHFAASAYGQAVGAVQIDCKQFASFAERVAVHRTVESKLELVIAIMRQQFEKPDSPDVQAYVREARRVYSEGLPPEEAKFQAFKRCTAVLGRFGPEV